MSKLYFILLPPCITSLYAFIFMINVVRNVQFTKDKIYIILTLSSFPVSNYLKIVNILMLKRLIKRIPFNCFLREENHIAFIIKLLIVFGTKNILKFLIASFIFSSKGRIPKFHRSPRQKCDIFFFYKTIFRHQK